MLDSNIPAAKIRRSPFVSISPDRYQSLDRDFTLAWRCTEDDDLAYDILAQRDEIFTVMKSQAMDTQRKRCRGQGPRPVYRSLTADWIIHHRALLAAIERFEKIKQSQAGYFTQLQHLDRLLRSIASMTLRHNSFYAAVALMQVLGKYTDSDTLSIYSKVFDGSDRRTWKEDSQVGRVKRSIVNELSGRLAGFALARGRASGKPRPISPHAEYLVESFPGTLPHLPDNMKQERYESEAFFEVKRIMEFFHIDRFDIHAAGVGSFRDRLALPRFDGFDPDDKPDPPTPEPKKKTPRFDLERLERAIAEKRRIRENFVPRGLSVHVDGVPREDLDWMNDVCAMRLEEGADLIELVGLDDNNQKVTLAAHFLTYDGAKSETCIANIPGLGEIRGKFTYYKNHTVRVDFRLIEPRKWTTVLPTVRACAVDEHASVLHIHAPAIQEGNTEHEWIDLHIKDLPITKVLSKDENVRVFILDSSSNEKKLTTDKFLSNALFELALGTRIYYTTNGTPSTDSSRIYKGAITVSAKDTLHVIAMAVGYHNDFWQFLALSKEVLDDLVYECEEDMRPQKFARIAVWNNKTATATKPVRVHQLKDKVMARADNRENSAVELARLHSIDDASRRVVYEVALRYLLAVAVSLTASHDHLRPNVVIDLSDDYLCVLKELVVSNKNTRRKEFMWDLLINKTDAVDRPNAGSLHFRRLYSSNTKPPNVADWENFTAARVLWKSLVDRNTSKSDVDLKRILRVFGRSPQDAKKIVQALLEHGSIQSPRVFSMILAKQLGMTERAAFALEELSNIHPVCGYESDGSCRSPLMKTCEDVSTIVKATKGGFDCENFHYTISS